MSGKVSVVLRFLGALVAGVLLLTFVAIRVVSSPPPDGETGAPAPQVSVTPEPGSPDVGSGCRVRGWARAAQANARTLKTLAWAPFGRPEIGWETYAPLIQREIGTDCPPASEGFAAAFAAWQGDQRLVPDGVVGEEDFQRLRAKLYEDRPRAQFTSGGDGCAPTSEPLVQARKEEGYAGKAILLQPRALAAYRRMVAAARAEAPEIAQDPRNLTIFSGFRSPAADAQRCDREGNCDGVVRARCSRHRTGLVIDVYVGQAPGYPPDSTADANRRHMAGTAAYRWLVGNAHRFGFVNYPYEPWHWEFAGAPVDIAD